MDAAAGSSKPSFLGSIPSRSANTERRKEMTLEEFLKQLKNLPLNQRQAFIRLNIPILNIEAVDNLNKAVREILRKRRAN